MFSPINYTKSQFLEYKKKILFPLNKKFMSWTIDFNNSKTKCGSCEYATKTIYISKLYINSEKCNNLDINNTLLHEIAHIIAGIEHNHDNVWRSIAKQIGCDITLNNIKFCEPKYILNCYNKCYNDLYFYNNLGLKNRKCKKCNKLLIIITK